jgi:hypothetical protein
MCHNLLMGLMSRRPVTAEAAGSSPVSRAILFKHLSIFFLRFGSGQGPRCDSGHLDPEFGGCADDRLSRKAANADHRDPRRGGHSIFSESHFLICDGPTIRFGATGLMVPALTSTPAASSAAANFLASLSLVKDCERRE